MGDPYDPYREALVVETETLWPSETQEVVAGWSAERRRVVERGIHATAADASQLEYVRVHTGFCRQITMTSADLDRWLKQESSTANSLPS